MRASLTLLGDINTVMEGTNTRVVVIIPRLLLGVKKHWVRDALVASRHALSVIAPQTLDEVAAEPPAHFKFNVECLLDGTGQI